MTRKARLLAVTACSSISFIAVWCMTQTIARRLDYQPALGTEFWRVGDLHLYAPWAGFGWWLHYRNSAPGLFHIAPWALAWIGAPCLIILLLQSGLGRTAPALTTYGSSRWAGRRDLQRAKLFGRDGVVLGTWRGRYLRHAGPDHILAFAPTRSGKGVGLVVPTLLSWTGSAIVHDIKGENWQLTAGWRARFSRCLCFDPTDPRSARYNPLLEVRRDAREVADVQNIADILIDPEGLLERRNHWEQSSHSLLVGAILHVLHVGQDKSLAGVGRLLSDPDRPFAATLDEMRHANHQGSAEAPCTHPVVAAAARDLLNKSDAERSGILSTAIGFLALYRDPIIARVTSGSDWRIADLRDNAKPVSLYLVVPPSDISRTRALIRLILNQIARRLTEQMPEPSRTSQPILLMLDEFPALGRLDFFETSLAFLAGYGVRAFLVAQSLHQIAKAYGENSSIVDNCHVRITFATNDDRTAKRISDSLGTATEQRAMRSYGGNRLAAWLPHVTESHQETARALLTPGEIMQLPGEEAVLIVAGCPPVRATKLRYHEDRNFRARVLPAPTLAIRAPDVALPGAARDETTQTITLPSVPGASLGIRNKPRTEGTAHAMLGLDDIEVAALPNAVDGDVSRRAVRPSARISKGGEHA